jgi:hypothetical protein
VQPSGSVDFCQLRQSGFGKPERIDASQEILKRIPMRGLSEIAIRAKPIAGQYIRLRIGADD